MKILILVYNYFESPMGTRARYLFQNFPKNQDIKIVYRNSNNFVDLFRFLKETIQYSPDIIYNLDIGIPSLASSVVCKLIKLGKTEIILDTGDLLYDLAKAIGTYNKITEFLIFITEKLFLSFADKIIVRGTGHKILLNERGLNNVQVVYDGIDSAFSKPLDVSDLRKSLELDDYLTVGLIGNLDWIENYDICYGWELIEAMKYLKELKIKGIIIGDGTGLNYLKTKSKEYGISENIFFKGRIPYKDVPKYINLIDVCLLTQPNVLFTQIKTTGKLPEYLGCGKFIIASKVGEAEQVIKENGILLDYNGFKDVSYPIRLADSLKKIYENKIDVNSKGLIGVKIAKSKFDYKILSEKLEKILFNNE